MRKHIANSHSKNREKYEKMNRSQHEPKPARVPKKKKKKAINLFDKYHKKRDNSKMRDRSERPQSKTRKAKLPIYPMKSS